MRAEKKTMLSTFDPTWQYSLASLEKATYFHNLKLSFFLSFFFKKKKNAKYNLFPLDI
jgi:hypothetical protein